LTGGSLVLYGLTFTVASGSGCSLNGGACTGLNLINVPDGRGNIEFELVGSGGTNSAALSLTPIANISSTATLSFTVGVTQTSGQPTTKVTSAALSTTGIDSYTCAVSPSSTCTSGTTAKTQVTFSRITINPTSLTQVLTSPASGLQTPGFTSTAHASADNSFSLTETLSLGALKSADYTGVTTLQLNTAALAFRAAPEPASIMVLLSAIGGMAAVRRRKTFGASPS
jgi:hypothetical protein